MKMGGNRPVDHIKIRIWQFVLFALVLLAWEASARLGFSDVTWTSSPEKIITEFWRSTSKGELPVHLLVTLSEAVSGFLLGSALGILLGLILGVSRTLGMIIEPFIMAINCLPRVALGPLVVMYLGIGFASKFALAFSLVVVPVMINVFEGIRSVDAVLVNFMLTSGASRGQIFFKLLLPNCVPWIFSALRVSISFSMIGAIVGEFISARSGIGYMIDTAAGAFNVTGILMPLIVLMLITFLFDRSFVAIRNHFLHWRLDA
jgi:NitT/TauT family transport system permease protein